jgi:hypothetical protein
VQAFAPAALPLRAGRMGASCRSGVRAATCAMDMTGAQSMMIAAAKVAAEAAEDAEDVVEVATRTGPAISIVGKTIGGNILIVVPILGAVVVFSVIAYILTQTLYMPQDVADVSDRKSE